jgi:hypothetical protein
MTGDVSQVGNLLTPVAFQGSGCFSPVSCKVNGSTDLHLQLRAGERASFGETIELKIVPE